MSPSADKPSSAAGRARARCFRSRTLISHPERNQERSSFGDAMLLAFVIAQALDGALVYLGIAAFGAAAEANPVVAWYVSALGAGACLAAVTGGPIPSAPTPDVTPPHRIPRSLA